MQRAFLGSSGIEASRIGFGCMGLSGSYGAVERGAALATLDAALEAAVDFFDTADVYGGGENERLLGAALHSHRNRVVLATKGGATRDAQGRATNDGTPDYLIRACEASLRRLGTDRIDLYYLHRVDPAVPIEDSVGALSRLVEQGKIRAIGLSEVSAATLRRACKVHPVAALQTEYSLACRFVEQDILAACEALNVAFVAYSPLGRGLLGGSLPGGLAAVLGEGDLRAQIPRFQAGNREANQAAVERFHALAHELSLAPAQVALTWLLQRPAAPFLIPGSRDPLRAQRNAAAARLTLPPEAMERPGSAVR